MVNIAAKPLDIFKISVVLIVLYHVADYWTPQINLIDTKLYIRRLNCEISGGCRNQNRQILYLIRTHVYSKMLLSILKESANTTQRYWLTATKRIIIIKHPAVKVKICVMTLKVEIAFITQVLDWQWTSSYNCTESVIKIY